MSTPIHEHGHVIRVRVRKRMCGNDCIGCPHPAVVVEVRMPSGRRRELWAEPPGGRRGPARTTEVVVPDRTRAARRGATWGESVVEEDD